MPRFFDDYSNTYLTHDSAAGRKQQRRGWKFRENFKLHYQKHVVEWQKGGMGLASAQQAFIRARGRDDLMISPLPDGWKEDTDECTGISFYHNEETGERSWVRPGFIPPPPGGGMMNRGGGGGGSGGSGGGGPMSNHHHRGMGMNGNNHHHNNHHSGGNYNNSNNSNNNNSRPVRDDANPSPGTTNPQWSEWYKTPLAAALGDVVEIRGKPRRENSNDTSNSSNDGADCFFAITSTDGTVHLFESIRAPDSRAIVKAIRWASARWSRLVIAGDATSLLAEFYNESSPTQKDECEAESEFDSKFDSETKSRALSPTETMNRLSHAFLDDVTGAS